MILRLQGGTKKKAEISPSSSFVSVVWSLRGVFGCCGSSSSGNTLVIAQACLVTQGRETKETNRSQRGSQTRWCGNSKRLTGQATPSGSIQQPIDFIPNHFPTSRQSSLRQNKRGNRHGLLASEDVPSDARHVEVCVESIDTRGHFEFYRLKFQNSNYLTPEVQSNLGILEP